MKDLSFLSIKYLSIVIILFQISPETEFLYQLACFRRQSANQRIGVPEFEPDFVKYFKSYCLDGLID